MKNGPLTIIIGILLAFTTSGATIDRLSVYSPSMGKDVPVSVILPDAYANATNSPHSVIVALHGAGGDSFGFFAGEGGVMSDLADRFDLIIVCPDGAKNGWWLDSPIRPEMKYETFVVGEVLPFIDGKYRTIPDRGHRGIMGVSMGGHGACYLGFRHKDLFGVIGNIVGGVDLTPWDGHWGITGVLGSFRENQKVWSQYSAISQTADLKDGEVKLITIVGTSDFFLGVNRTMHDLLSARRIRHTYVEIRGEDEIHSSHTLDFAYGVMPVVIRFFDEFFKTGKGSL